MTPGTFPATSKLVIYRGAADSYALTFKDSSNNAIDLSGRTFVAEVRNAPERSVVLAMTVTGTDLANGIITISWTAADTVNLRPGDATWGLIDDLDQLWIEDTCTITKKTPQNV